MSDAVGNLLTYVERTLIQWQNRDRTKDPPNADFAGPPDLGEQLDRLTREIGRESLVLVGRGVQKELSNTVGACVAACAMFHNASGALRLLRDPSQLGIERGLQPISSESKDEIRLAFEKAREELFASLSPLRILRDQLLAAGPAETSIETGQRSPKSVATTKAKVIPRPPDQQVDIVALGLAIVAQADRDDEKRT
jgi:hypothetical protein